MVGVHGRGTMKLRFTVSGRVAKPIGAVFDAVADPAILSE